MINAQALIDYENFRCARVGIFVDVGDPARSARILREQGEAIERLAALFGARILLVEGRRLFSEQIIERDLADAWLLLVAEGPSRALATRGNPHRLNLDARTEWEPYAYREILRQIRESTRILEDVTGYYGRLEPESRKHPAPLEQRSN